jgi:hypothetical protein
MAGHAARPAIVVAAVVLAAAMAVSLLHASTPPSAGRVPAAQPSTDTTFAQPYPPWSGGHFHTQAPGHQPPHEKPRLLSYRQSSSR